MSALYLKTAQAAKLAAVPLSTIYTAYNRHGHWEGITPRKNPAGRLIWPASEVRDRFEAATEVQPQGLEQYVAWAVSIAPEVEPHSLARLGRALLASEAVPGWKPAPGQLDAKRVAAEAVILALALQAWVERWDEACVAAGVTVAESEHAWLCRVISAKFLPGADHG
jgi:hypothetical protein